MPQVPMPSGPPNWFNAGQQQAPWHHQQGQPQHHQSANQQAPHVHDTDSWDSWGNWVSPQRPLWKIPRKNMEGLFKFDGELGQYKPWKSRIRDHCSEEWAQWRQVLDHAERVPYGLKTEHLQNTTLFGISASALSSDLWSFLLRWIWSTSVPPPNEDCPEHRGERAGIVAATIH